MRCQALDRKTGKQCEREAVEGKRVCEIHGGLSTGQKTELGFMRARR